MTHLTVRAPRARAFPLCLFEDKTETAMPVAFDGICTPENGLWFHKAKLLVGPRAAEHGRPFA
jgi:hypothetical protein